MVLACRLEEWLILFDLTLWMDVKRSKVKWEIYDSSEAACFTGLMEIAIVNLCITELYFSFYRVLGVWYEC